MGNWTVKGSFFSINLSNPSKIMACFIIRSSSAVFGNPGSLPQIHLRDVQSPWELVKRFPLIKTLKCSQYS